MKVAYHLAIVLLWVGYTLAFFGGLNALRPGFKPFKPFDDNEIPNFWGCEKLPPGGLFYHEFVRDKDGIQYLMLTPQGSCQCDNCNECSKFKFEWREFKYTNEAISALLNAVQSSTAMAGNTECNYDFQYIHTGSVICGFRLLHGSSCGYIDDNPKILDGFKDVFQHRFKHGKMPDALCIVAGYDEGPMYYIVYGTNLEKVQTIPCEFFMDIKLCNG